ncbi:pyocin knob domain-containing protein, partial [Lactococcus lactis]
KLDSTTDKTFNGTADVTDIGVSGVLPIANGGTGNTTGSAKDLVTSYIPANSDLDTYLTAGWYRNTFASGITNMPPETLGMWFSLEVLVVNDANVIQRYYDIPSGRWFIRRYYASPVVWSDWKEIYSGNSIIPIANGGTGNNLGLSVGQSLKGTLSNADDLNNYKSIGKWTVGGNKPANSPTNGDPYAIVTVESSENSSGFIIQTYKDILNKVFIRTLAGSPAVWRAWIQLSDDSTVVHNTGDETIAGVKSFTQKVNASISGNAGTATKLETSRKIDGKNFDGTKDIVLDVVHNTGDENIAGAKTFTDTLIANSPIKGNTQRYYIEDGYDLNGYTDVGDFILNGANNLVNYPNAASTYASLHVEKLSGNTSIQTLTDSNHRIFTRIYGGNPASFGEWRMIDSPYRLVPVPSYIGSFYSLLDFQKNEYGLGTTVIYSSVNISYNDGPHTVSNTFKVTVDLFNWGNGNSSNYAFIKVEEPKSIYRGYYDYKGFSGWSKQTYG